jgi:hypothetical protein
VHDIQEERRGRGRGLLQGLTLYFPGLNKEKHEKFLITLRVLSQGFANVM